MKVTITIACTEIKVNGTFLKANPDQPEEITGFEVTKAFVNEEEMPFASHIIAVNIEETEAHTVK